MARNLNMTSLARQCAATLFAWAGLAPAAPPLPDPTQPPSAARAPGAAAARPAARASAPAPRVRVTSILVTQRGEASAWVDGRLLRVGEQTAAGETVARIDAQGVTLSGPRGTQRLWLMTGVAGPHPRAATPDPIPQQAPVEVAGSPPP